MARYSKAEVSESLAKLREHLKPGMTVYADVRHVSRSGMQRTIQLSVFLGVDERGNVDRRFLGYHAARVLGWSWDNKRDGVKVSGCGMDMRFHLVYHLSHALFPQYACLGKNCPSPAHHSSGYGVRGVSRDVRHTHTNDGYALRMEGL